MRACLAALAGGILTGGLLFAAAAVAQTSSSDTEPADVFAAELMRARILGRLGRAEEALGAFARLVRQRPTDADLRDEYVELLLEAGLLEPAQAIVDTSPESPRVSRLQARLDLLMRRPRLASERLAALRAQAPDDVFLAADLAGALTQEGRWGEALALYGGILEVRPENEEVRRLYRELALAHAPRLEIQHRTLLQVAATHHVEEIAYRTWLGQRWWGRAGVRYGNYHQDAVPGLEGFTEEIETALLGAGYTVDPRWTVRAALEGAHRDGVVIPAFRLGGVFDDARATSAALDIAVRELLTNPVIAIPRRGTTDRITFDGARRIAERVTVAAHYDRRMYRVSDHDLGTEWEAATRVEWALLRGRVDVTFYPQIFHSEYRAVAHSPVREQIAFIKRQDVGSLGLLIGMELLPGLRAEVGSVGRRDVYRAITSWEVTADVRWRIQQRLELRVLYTRNTEGSHIGGKEESFTGALHVLY